MADVAFKEEKFPSTSAGPDCPYCPPPPEFRIPAPPEPFAFWTEDDFSFEIHSNSTGESQFQCDLIYNGSAINFEPAIGASSWFSIFTEDILLLIIGVVILTVMAVTGIGLLVHFNRYVKIFN